MLQNQPLHNLTIKDQHLLKPPTVMGATESFGRRASDGGANLHIYYPTSTGSNPPPAQGQMESYYSGSPQGETSKGTTVPEVVKITDDAVVSNPAETGEETNDEIQRYMHGRGCSKRHTVGCTDEFSCPHIVNNENGTENQLTHSSAPQSAVGRIRRTGLLTVTERPPDFFVLSGHEKPVLLQEL